CQRRQAARADRQAGWDVDFAAILQSKLFQNGLYGPAPERRFQGVHAMSDAVKIGFVPFSAAPRGTVIVFTDESLKLGQRTTKVLGAAADNITRAAAAAKFKGKSRSALEILAPAGLKADRLLVVGT